MGVCNFYGKGHLKKIRNMAMEKEERNQLG